MDGLGDGAAAVATATDEQRVDFQWKTIQRFDYYIGTTNTKAAIFLTLDTFVTGAIVLKWSELVQYFGPHPASIAFANGFLVLAAAAALVSWWFALFGIEPILKSPKQPQRYHSLVFFGHVAEYQEPEHYVEAAKKTSLSQYANDLGMQAHALARIAGRKFWWFRWAARIMLFVQLPAFVGMVATLLVSFLCQHFGGGQQP